MGLSGTIAISHEIKSPPDKFYNLLKTQLYHLPNITEGIKNIEVHEGDWHIDGTIKQWTYNLDGKTLTAKEKVSFDDINKSITMVVLEGDLLKEYKSYVNIVKVSTNEDGKTTLSWIVNYEKVNAEVPIPASYLFLYEKLTEEVDAHVLKN